MEAVIAKARVLVEALPFISEFRGKTVVVKIGGAALEDEALRQRFCEDLVLLDWVGLRRSSTASASPTPRSSRWSRWCWAASSTPSWCG